MGVLEERFSAKHGFLWEIVHKATITSMDCGDLRLDSPASAVKTRLTPNEKLVPGGILEPVSGRAVLFFTSSHKTSDF